MPFRILSLDGGGIRGVIAATMLAEIEKQINQPLNQYFDMVAGTSTGAILASAIATGTSSQKIVELYRQKASTIFPYQSRFSPQRIGLVMQYGLSAPKYPDTGLIQVLQAAFGSKQLWEVGSSPRLLVTSYDTINREPIIFKSWRKDKPYGNVPLWEVCVCSASAPTYFPAHKLQKKADGNIRKASAYTVTLGEDASSVEGEYRHMQITIIDGTGMGQTRTITEYNGLTRTARVDTALKKIPDSTSTYTITGIYSAIDGGVAANNPSSCAVAEALRLGHSVQEITVLSLGTGDQTDVIPLEKAQEWGAVEWAVPLVGVLFDASSDIYEYITKQIIDNRLLRLQFKLDRDLTGKILSDEIDDATPENVSNLIEAAHVYINQPQVQAGVQEFLRINSV